MAFATLTELAKLGQDDLTAGLAETITTVNPIFSMLPFNTMQGNAYAFNREKTLGTVVSGGRSVSLTNAGGAATFDQVTQVLSTIIGQVEIAGLDAAQGTGTGVGNDPAAIQVALKAKAVGREFQRQMILGDSASPSASNVTGTINEGEFSGLIKLIGSDAAFASQKLDQANAVLTLDMLDLLKDMVTAGKAEFIMTSPAGVRKIRSLLRGLGGVTTMEVGGKMVDAFDGIPLFASEFVPTDAVGGTAGNQTHILCGMFDDGSRRLGISGIVPEGSAGLILEDVGVSQTSDATIKRVKMYSSLAIHSVKSVAGLWNVTVGV